jgi:hypothetical protein
MGGNMMGRGREHDGEDDRNMMEKRTGKGWGRGWEHDGDEDGNIMEKRAGT